MRRGCADKIRHGDVQQRSSIATSVRDLQAPNPGARRKRGQARVASYGRTLVTKLSRQHLIMNACQGMRRCRGAHRSGFRLTHLGGCPLMGWPHRRLPVFWPREQRPHWGRPSRLDTSHNPPRPPGSRGPVHGVRVSGGTSHGAMRAGANDSKGAPFDPILRPRS